MGAEDPLKDEANRGRTWDPFSMPMDVLGRAWFTSLPAVPVSSRLAIARDIELLSASSAGHDVFPHPSFIIAGQHQRCTGRTPVETMHPTPGCLSCKSRKKKCDAVKPFCSGCTRNYLVCVWPTEAQGRPRGTRGIVSWSMLAEPGVACYCVT